MEDQRKRYEKFSDNKGT